MDGSERYTACTLLPRLPFAAVNRRGSQHHDPSLQRHHLLPRQALGKACFARLFDRLGRDRIGFDDFRRNGLLLPAREAASHRLALPLHRGPHRRYNQLAIERMGRIEAHWARDRDRDTEAADHAALMRLGLLQRALRRSLLDSRRSLVLNRKDPLGRGIDFADLDAMAEWLWRQTEA